MKIRQFPILSPRTALRNIKRGTQFMGTLSRVPEIRAAMEENAGYSEAHHAEGWRVLLTALGYYNRSPAPAASPVEAPASGAIRILDGADGITFDRTRSTLQYRYPAQNAYIFEGLTAETGSGAVGSMSTYVTRVAALRDGTDPARAAHREEDRAAVELLAERKIFDAEIQAHLESLIEQAQQLAPAPGAVAPEQAEAFAEEMDRAAAELHVWLVDWAAQARACITRRDYLIRLGLTSRRRFEDDDEEDADNDVMSAAQGVAAG